MNDAATYQEDVLARYGQSSAVKITQNQYHGGIEVVLENGKRLWFSAKLTISDMGIKPVIEVVFPDDEMAPRFRPST